jgi:hypothetical protein
MRDDCISIGVGQIQLERAVIAQDLLFKKGILKEKLSERKLKAKLLSDDKFYDDLIINYILEKSGSI